MIKVLNLYAGIGGNRKLWNNVEVTGVEINPKIAAIYKDFFHDDDVVVCDAHKYLLEHFSEFDFIWCSPPCPSHSKFRKSLGCFVGAKPVFPDMKLYEEILFLKHYFKGQWVVENVVPYYTPLIEAVLIQRHLFWSNFIINQEHFKRDKIDLRRDKEKNQIEVKKFEKLYGFCLEQYKNIDKLKILRNCVNPDLAKHIFDCAFDQDKISQKKLQSFISSDKPPSL